MTSTLHRASLLPLLAAAACATTSGSTKGPMNEGIVQTGHPVLRARAAEVAPERITTAGFQALIARMVEAMRQAPGVGLAAPQLGISQRVLVLEDPEALMAGLTELERTERERRPVPLKVFINPTLTPIGDEKVMFFEGCLSVAGFAGMVERWREVEVTGLDEHAQPQTWRVKGWPARILQHEVDHLDGALYLDRMKTRTFTTQAQLKAQYAGKPIAEVKGLLGVEP